MLYQKIFQQMDANLRRALLLKGLTDIENVNLRLQKLENLSKHVEVNEDPERGVITMCHFCDKPIGLSGFEYDPEKGSMVHSYHL